MGLAVLDGLKQRAPNEQQGYKEDAGNHSTSHRLSSGATRFELRGR